ncbi:hypothetical protein GBF38_005552 [Nibea albiflora]|uniref:Uncharacterized protein n=1 Tax=Nibea albiflora TaxID=240163 RepID=A0ACB7EWJ5_NIBAL|nr:hypothetical protein GBF38_005552 [Nibea albiflora]
MQWTVQVIVVLLNVAWIVFFLQPDPFSVSVQRRSSERSDEEMLFRQFCIQPHPDMNWTPTVHSANLTSNKTNSTNTTAEEKTELSLNEVHVINKTHDCQCNNTHMKQSDYSGFLDIRFRAPAPGCKPMIILYPTSSIRNGAAGEEGQQGTHGEPGPLAPQRIPGQAGIPGQPGQRGPPGIYGPPGLAESTYHITI